MRSLARECVYKFLFSKLFNPDDEGLFAVLCKPLGDSDKKFAEELLKAVSDNETVILERIAEISTGYRLERVHSTDKVAILIGAAELGRFKDTPVPVVINEAVNLSAKYSGENGADFVNGILGEYVKRFI